MSIKSHAPVARFIAIALLAVSTVVAARADWTPWAKVANGNGVEVSFRQVNDSVCTWRFRNGGTSTLRAFEYNYTFVPAVPPAASSLTKVTRFDTLSEPLKRGRYEGESLVFSAETHSCPADISVQRIQWDRD